MNIPRIPAPVLATSLLALLIPAAQSQTTSRVSVDSAGGESNANSSRPDLSDDGRWVTFYSDATNLVTGDGNGVSDIFLHDRQSGATTRISVSSGGAEGNGKSSRPHISADCRWVAFYSDATNLVTGDVNGWRDVFAHDRVTGTTVLVSVGTSGAQGNGESSRAAISGDGRYIAFRSHATNLVAGDTNGFGDVFLRDRDTDGDGVFDEPGAVSTALVSVSSAGVQGNELSSVPNLSADGRHVAFRSEASNLVAGDTNAARDVFVRDVLAGTTVRVSVRTNGNEGNADSSRPTISADGRFVAYYSSASNLVSGDTNQHCFLDPLNQPVCEPAEDCFVRDRDKDGNGVFDEAGGVRTVRVSVRTNGNQGNDRSEDPEISPDGRFVTFWSEATNLFAGDTNGVIDVLLHDRDADENGVYDQAGGISTTLVSLSTAGVQANAESKRQVISADGAFVAYRSDASNLVAGDGNAVPDVFVLQRSSCVGSSVTYCTAGTSASGCLALLSASGSASPTAPSGFTVSAGSVEAAKDGLFFYGQNGRQANPWGNGTSYQCVVPPVRRGGLQIGSGTAGTCEGSFSQDLNARWCGSCPKPLQAPVVGVPLQIQFWYRDPQNTSNRTTGLSDALEAEVCPVNPMPLFVVPLLLAHDPPLLQPSPDAWSTLDREIESLELAATEDPPFVVGGYLKFSYRASDDLVFRLEPGTFEDMGDQGGFQFDSAALNFRSEVGIFSVKVAYNPVVGKLRSTYIRFRPADPVRVTVGRFKMPVLRSRLVSTTRLLFLDRSVQARQTGPRDEGVKLEVELGGDVELILAAQNGSDEAGDSLAFSSRLEAGLLGGGVGKYEGAWGADEPELTLGLSASAEEGMEDDLLLAGDLAFSAGRFSLHTEVLDYDEGFGPYDLDLLDPFSIIPRADSNPFSVSTSFMVLPDRLELGVRLEDFDDPNDTRRWTFGLNHYMEGHDAKWAVNWLTVETDNELLESDVLAVGLVVRI